jgi:transposase
LNGRGCRVVNPDQFQLLSRSVKKTDEHDAKVLVELLPKGLLPEVRMKEEVQARGKVVKVRTTLKNKVNNLLLARGILIRKESMSSEKGLAKVLASPVSELENAWNWISWLERFGT